MQKILVAFDNGQYSEGVMKFAMQLNENAPILLAGAFLPQVDYASLWSYAPGSLAEGMYAPLIEKETAATLQENIDRFKAFCEQNKIRYSIHKDYFDFALPELKRETLYADLLVISSELFYSRTGDRSINDYLKEILQHTACPVMIVPEKFEFPMNNILTCDGKPSSIYAIKQFAYLFPEMSSNNSMLVYADESDGGEFLPQMDSIMELAQCHYPKLKQAKLDIDGRKYFNTWLTEVKKPVVISGAFGRSGFSMLMKKSFIADVIADHKLPVFIAHQ